LKTLSLLSHTSSTFNIQLQLEKSGKLRAGSRSQGQGTSSVDGADSEEYESGQFFGEMALVGGHVVEKDVNAVREIGTDSEERSQLVCFLVWVGVSIIFLKLRMFSLKQ